MLNLTEKQLQSLESLRNGAQDLLAVDGRNSNTFLLKWLVARDFDAAKAEQMLRDSIEWREKNRIDDILQWEPPEVLKLYYPVGIIGSDKDGCPVLIVPFGRCDIRGLLKAAGKEAFVRYTFQILEQCLAYRCPGHGDRKVEQIVVIFDMEGLCLRNVISKTVIDVALEIVRDFEDNYPEILKDAYVINAPSVFKILFDLVKPLISMRTMKKIDIFGYDREKWEKAILATVPAEELPKRWGGTRETNDEFCSSEICLGGIVPEKYFTMSNADITADTTTSSGT